MNKYSFAEGENPPKCSVRSENLIPLASVTGRAEILADGTRAGFWF